MVRMNSTPAHSCDSCDRLEKCLSEGKVIDATLLVFGKRHYVLAMGAMCDAEMAHVESIYKEQPE